MLMRYGERYIYRRENRKDESLEHRNKNPEPKEHRRDDKMGQIGKIPRTRWSPVTFQKSLRESDKGLTRWLTISIMIISGASHTIGPIKRFK